MKALEIVVGLAILFSWVNSTHASRKSGPNVAVQWNSAARQGTRDSKVSSPISVRALAIVHTCMYDAWAAFDEHAVGTQLGGALRRPASERSLANKEKAISYAAYRALTDLLPGDIDSVYKPLMKTLGYDPNDTSTDIETPAGIGNVACAAVLESRHHDKSNQLGDLALGPYSDWTHFRPVNMPIAFPLHLPVIHPIDMNHWEPLIYVNPTGDYATQMFSTAHWCNVTPFALSSGDEFRAQTKDFLPVPYGSPEFREQAEELVTLSGELDDERKALAEYWSDGPEFEEAALRWNEFAAWVSVRDRHTLDDDLKMFFALNNALLDASIAAWEMKRTYDSMRPVTAIPLLLNGRKIRAWGGPGKGTVEMDGSQWTPYQPSTAPTPPSPDYVSEESTHSAAAAEILKAWTGSDQFGYSTTVAAGSSVIEPNTTPHRDISLSWATFTAAANDAGMAGRYAGLHFRHSDLAGRKLGALVAAKVWSTANVYFDGTRQGLPEKALNTK